MGQLLCLCHEHDYYGELLRVIFMVHASVSPQCSSMGIGNSSINESKLSTRHICINDVKHIVTDCAPFVVDEDLQATHRHIIRHSGLGDQSDRISC